MIFHKNPAFLPPPAAYVLCIFLFIVRGHVRASAGIDFASPA